MGITILGHLVPCMGRALGPLRNFPGLGLRIAGPGRAWAEQIFNTSVLGGTGPRVSGPG